MYYVCACATCFAFGLTRISVRSRATFEREVSFRTRNSQITVKELVSLHIEQIKHVNPAINAVVQASSWCGYLGEMLSDSSPLASNQV